MAKKTKSRYELKEKLGEGGMGVVWRAHDTVLNSDVALKMLLDVHDATALKLFYEECNRQASLVHPNVIEVRDVGSFDEDGVRQPYLIMPLLRGKTLADLMRESRDVLSVERCIDIFTQACRGLHAAHDHGLIHRDIKPTNIFILDDDSVKIIDFGIAHRIELTRTTGRKGTLLYMSPEQLLVKPLTRASDVFSLAVVCYEALTGKQPFVRVSEEAIAEAIQHWMPPPVSTLNPDASKTLSQVLHKAMAKLPAYRYATAKEFGDTLRRAFYDPTFLVLDPAKFAPRLAKASEAFERGDLDFAQEIVADLEMEGYLGTEFEQLVANVRAAIQRRDVEQILESAKARMQDGEYRLALQRIHEALQLDDRSPDALALQHEVEAQRAEADIREWLEVGRQHLEKLSFSHARQAANRILEQHPQEERARQLLSQIERKKSEYQNIREQKQQVYAAVLEAQRQNDLTSALSKMKQVLDLDKQAPDLQDPGRSAHFQSLYNKLRAEHEALANRYREAKQALENGEFAVVSRICDDLLETYPQHTLFKALKYDNDQRWRRAISSKIIQVEEEAEKESDLDRRVAMLEEIVRQNPEINEFRNLLRAGSDKRDLVSGIVAKARELADREQFGEALVQWETLQTIHPRYPGLDFEIDNTRRRRALAERVALKKRWLNQIHREIEDSRFDDALKSLSMALEDFPHDGELLEIEKSVRQQQRIVSEAEQLISEGRARFEAGDFPGGLQKLRQAHEAGSKVTSAKAGLIDGLLRAARASQDDSELASSYLREILNLDSANQAAVGMLRFLEDKAENERADHAIVKARQLQTNSDFLPAIKLLQEAIGKSPLNPRLQEVLREIENSQKDVRDHDLEVVRRKRLELGESADARAIYRQIDAAKQLADRYQDDEEFLEESKLLQTRLHTMASATRTSISEKTKTLPRMMEKPPARVQPKQKHWMLAASTAAIIVVLASGALIHSLGSRKSKVANAAIAAHPATRQHTAKAGESSAGLSNSPAAPSAAVPSSSQPSPQELEIQGDGTVSIDGEDPVVVRNSLFSSTLVAGDHQIQWTSRSGETSIFDVAVQSGGRATIEQPFVSSNKIPLMIVSTADHSASVYSSIPAVLQIDGQRKGQATKKGLNISVQNGMHEFRVLSPYGTGKQNVDVEPRRKLAVSFGPSSNRGAIAIHVDQPDVDVTLLNSGKASRTAHITDKTIALNNLAPGEYSVQVHRDGFQEPPVAPIRVESSETAYVDFKLQQLVSILVHSLPQADILLDGKEAGLTDGDGHLTLNNLTFAPHKIEAHRRGKSAVMELQLSSADSRRTVELRLDRGPGTVVLTVTPPSATVSVEQADGKTVPISGRRFDLPAGHYRITARAPQYSDRTETVDVVPEETSKLDLSLNSPKEPAQQKQATVNLDGWDPNAWDLDREHALISHKRTGIVLFSSQHSQGTYVFTLARNKSFGRGKGVLQWVAGYLDKDNYLLFSISHDGFQSFLVQNGHKIPHGATVPLPDLKEYSIAMDVQANRVDTFLLNGEKWAPLQDWTNVLEDLNRGQFGFKDQLMVYNFKFTARVSN